MKKLIVKSKKDKSFERELEAEHARNMVRIYPNDYYIQEEEVEKPKKKRETKEETNKDPEMGNE